MPGPKVSITLAALPSCMAMETFGQAMTQNGGPCLLVPVCPMEWWHIGPLVLALLVFLLAGTVIERNVEGAVLGFINRHQQPQSQATVGVEATHGQELPEQQDDWLQQQLLKKKKELEQQELLLQKLQQHELQKEERRQQANHDELLQQRLLQKKEELEQQKLHQKYQKQELQNEERSPQHTEEVKPSEKKSLPNTSVNRQFSASQAAWKPIVASSQLLQEPQLVQSKQRQQSLHQQVVQPIKQQSLQQQQSQQLKQQEPVHQFLQQQQPMQHQQQRQVQGLMRQQPRQHSDIQPPLPFVAVSEKSILQPTSKTTVGSKAMDMQSKPNT